MCIRWMMVIFLLAFCGLFVGASAKVDAAVTIEGVVNNNLPSLPGNGSAFSVHNASGATSSSLHVTTPGTTFSAGNINGMEVRGRGNSSAITASAGGWVNNGSLGSKTTVGGSLNSPFEFSTPSNGNVNGGSGGMRVWQTDSFSVSGASGGTTPIDLTVSLDGFMRLLSPSVNDSAGVTLTSTLIDSTGARHSLLSFSTFLNRDPIAAPLFHSTSSSAGFAGTDWENSFSLVGTDYYTQNYSETIIGAFSVANNSSFQIENFLNTAASGTSVSDYFSSASFGYAPGAAGSVLTASAVPEPSAFIPLLCGAFACVGYRRRKRPSESCEQ